MTDRDQASPPIGVLAYHMPGLGGTQQVMLRTARLLGERGWRFRALCPRGELSRAFSEMGVETFPWNVGDLRVSLGGAVTGVRHGASRAWKVKSAITGAALVHAHSLKACLVSWPACLASGVPLLWHVHDFLPLRRARRALVWMATRASDHVVAVSAAVAREVPARSATVVHNGIEWTPAPAPGGSRSLVVYLGRIDPEKKVEDFVRLAARLSGGATGARFVIAGEPSAGHERYAAQLEECAGREGLLDSGHLSFAGLVENVEDLLSRTVVLVIPSRREPFGLVALEAMRAGVPVVGTSGGGLDEIVVDGTTGYLVHAGDTDSMVARVEGLLRDPNRAGRMGAEARARFDQRFTARDYADGLEDVYRRLVG